MAQLNVRIPGDLLAAARDTATREDRSLRSLVERALMAYIFGVDHTGIPTAVTSTARDNRPSVHPKPKCPHPITRRIGRRCADCGETVK